MTDPSRNFGLPVLGIIGGIGSGKSSVAREACHQRPWFLLDADRIGHQILLLPEVITKLTEQFGTEILDADHQINRSALAERVFGTENQHYKQQLENIVHPLIRRMAVDQLDEAAKSGRYTLLILDAAILLEAGWQSLCDAVVFIETDWNQRLERVQQTRQWDAEELRQRESSQLPLEEKRNQADAVISNNGELSDAVNLLIDFVEQQFPETHFSNHQ